MIEGGFKPGLPLATGMSTKAGLLVQGTLLPAYGNWVGTSQSLDMVIVPALGDVVGSNIPSASASTTPVNTLAQPANLVLQWQAGQPMATAIQNALQTAFPSYTVNVNISSTLVSANPVFHVCPNLASFNNFVNATAINIAGNNNQNYRGIFISTNGTTINVSDGTGSNSAPIVNIAFQDLIGQPTWINLAEMQIRCPMRGDIQLGNTIRMPQLSFSPGQFIPQTTTPESGSFVASITGTKAQSAFQGTFYVTQVRHVGRYRSPDAAAWCSIINAITIGQSLVDFA
jgi:hypothetical protein